MPFRRTTTCAARLAGLALVVGCSGGAGPPGAAAGAGGQASSDSGGASGGGTDANGGATTAGSAGTAATVRVCGDGFSTVIADADDVAAIVDCTTIFGNLIVSNTTLTSLSLPNLVEVDGFFNCQLNPALTSVSLPALTTIGHVAFSGNEELTSLNLPNLATAGGMSIFVNKLTSLSLPKLVSVALEFDFVVVSGTADPLTSLSLPELATVGTEFGVRHTLLLTDLTLPKLATVGGGFQVEGNFALTNLTAPALATVQGFRIMANPVLPTCQVQALLQQLTNFSGMATIRDNNDAGTCQ
jgi:hypothetical protein